MPETMRPQPAAQGSLANLSSRGRPVRILVRVADFDLVIFDCDGVLVDSERLAVRTEAEILASLGWPLTQAEIVARFVGDQPPTCNRRSSGSWAEGSIGTLSSNSATGKCSSRNSSRCRTSWRRSARSRSPVCVASSGSHDKMRFTLGKTGLFDRFDGRIFSVDQVEHGKPAPDIFLFAAAQMGDRLLIDAPSSKTASPG